MKPLLAAAALAALMASGPCAFAQDHNYATQNNMATNSGQNDQGYGQVADVPANPDNLPRIPGALNQPGDPDAVTDDYTATHQPLLGTAGPVPAVSIPQPSQDNGR